MPVRRWGVWGAIAAIAVGGGLLAAQGSGILFQALYKASGGTSRTAYSKLSDFASVKDYGLVCDGVTDDTTLASAMITTIGSTSTTLVVPGACLLSSPLAFPDTMRFYFTGLGWTGSLSTFTTWQPVYSDQTGTSDPMFQISHYGDTGVGSFAINILNRADIPSAPTVGLGAASAIVVHQYSDTGPALQIDNTRSQPFITMKEASNSTNSNGTQGTGDFLSLFGYTTGSPNTTVQIGRLNNLLSFLSIDVSRPWTFQSGTTASALVANQANAGPGITINQTGAGNGLVLNQSGAAHGMQIVPAAGADGFFPLIINGRARAASFATSVDGSGPAVVLITKTGTGGGDGLAIVNKGTDKGIRIADASADVWSIDKRGKVIYPTGGAADIAGRAVLVTGTKTVSTTAVTASSVIMLTNCVGGGTIGLPQVGTVTASTSFVINSVQPGTASTLQAADTSTICWSLIN